MPIFLRFSRLFRRAGRIRPAAADRCGAAVLLVGAVAFSLSEHVSYGVALYWAVTTATTVGYGDVTPHHTAGRVIAAIVMLTTIPLIGAVFALAAGASALPRLRRILGMDTHMPTDPYTLVYGSHAIIPRVIEELRCTGESIVLVAPALPARAHEGVQLLRGDPTDDAVIHRANRRVRAGR